MKEENPPTPTIPYPNWMIKYIPPDEDNDENKEKETTNQLQNNNEK